MRNFIFVIPCIINLFYYYPNLAINIVKETPDLAHLSTDLNHTDT
jgi:hypothetical protein